MKMGLYISVRNLFSYDVIKPFTLSIKFHNLGGDLLAIETNVKFTLSEAQVWLDRDWVSPPNISATTRNCTKRVAKKGTKKTELTLLKDYSVLQRNYRKTEVTKPDNECMSHVAL